MRFVICQLSDMQHLRVLFVLATEHTLFRIFLILGAKFCFWETCMMMFVRILVQLSVEL